MILRPLSTTARLASFPISGGERGVARGRDEKKEDGSAAGQEDEDHSGG